MPAEGAKFLANDRLLTFEQMNQIVDAFGSLGVRKIRITGGEPLMRPGLSTLVSQLRQTLLDQTGESHLALTSNGMLLPDVVDDLRAAGLDRVNISLDTLREDSFQLISRRKGLDQVLAGIDAAVNVGLDVRLNALILRQVNLDEVIELTKFAMERGVTMRFIEFMPLDFDRQWDSEKMVSGEELRIRLREHFHSLHPITASDASQPSTDYAVVDQAEKTLGTVGFIDSVSKPFCGNCNRLRLTADGHLMNCLFGHQQWDLKAAFTEPSSTHSQTPTPIRDAILRVARDCVAAKKAAHGINSDGFVQPTPAMYQIGG
jgi:cyclic pyranopterin phosphate synthase